MLFLNPSLHIMFSHLLLQLVIISKIFASLVNDCLVPESQGSQCSEVEEWPKSDCDSQIIFYSCSDLKILQSKCHTLQNRQLIFDESARKCIEQNSFGLEMDNEGIDHTRNKRQNTRSGNAGDACQFNTDCLDQGYFCNQGICTCVTNYVQSGSYCYEAINPGQPGCQLPIQCSAVWFGATCTNSVCQCATGFRPVETRDGFVCVDATQQSCPLPGGNPGGIYGILRVNSAISTCIYGAPSCLVNGQPVDEQYDCIVDPGAGIGTGVCCPNRAFACNLPVDRGTTTGVQTLLNRWYYNSAIGRCQGFQWNGATGSSGNANNFESEDHCNTYCNFRCEYGNAQFSTGAGSVFQNKRISCSTTTCGSNYQCDTIGSSQLCCPTPDYICGINGGLVVPAGGAFSPGFAVQSPTNVATTPTTRFFYSSQTQTCQSFQYLGGGGNFNNFGTQRECESFCATTICTRGEPLKDNLGNNQPCSGTGSAGCPTSHSCVSNVCCPTQQNICSQSLQTGNNCGIGGGFSTRWYYNPTSRQCTSFTFAGCNGNANNFNTQLECQNYCRNATPEPKCLQGQAYRDSFNNFFQCSTSGFGTRCPANYECYYDGLLFGCCPTKAYTCSLNFNQGRRCGPQNSRWYYDTTSQSCQTFIFFGCDGNSNNFNNRDQCDEYCGTGTCSNGGNPYTETSGNRRVCSGSTTCPSNYECTNVQLSVSSRVNYCCPTKAFICGQGPVVGTTCGTGSTTKWYFNSNRQCTTFSYNGCNGNGNNFATQSDCENFCSSAGCPAGESVYLAIGSSTPLACNIQQSNSCPQGYTCRFDSTTRRNICCGGTTAGVCQSGERAYLDPRSRLPQQCQPNRATDCPSNFLCKFNPSLNQYYCCASSGNNQCPSGYAVFTSPATNIAQQCQVRSNFNQCPTGYSCQTPVIGSFQGYCCSNTPLCPSGYTVYQQTVTGASQPCTIGFSSCPAPYQCLSTITGSNSGYCCSLSAENTVCGAGSVYRINNSPVSCSPGFNTCPSGYSCQLDSTTNTYYCCSSSNTGLCGTGTVYSPNGIAVTCALGSINTCPASYACTPSSQTGLNYCCQGGTAGLCPSGSTLLTQNNVARSCSTSLNTCPSGYTCTRSSSTSSNFYCCSNTGLTVCGPNASPYQPGGSPVSCDPNNNRCPSTYNCQLYSPTSTYYCCRPNAALGVCPDGSTPGNTCSPSTISGCPAGQLCQQISATGLFQCCAQSTSGVCDDGGQLTAQTCSPNVPGSCFGGTCQLIRSTSRYQCCIGGTSCPNGGTPVSGQFCSPNVPGTCGSNVCQQLSSGRYQCCSPGNTNTQALTCQNNVVLYREPVTQQPIPCFAPGQSTGCPGGYSCQLTFPGNVYYCCSGGVTQNDVCPNNAQLYINPSTQSVQICTQPNQQSGCPAGFTCQLTTPLNRYLCCSGGGITNTDQYCGTFGTAFIYPGTTLALSCTPGVSQCPTGYGCLQNAATPVCCSGINRDNAKSVKIARDPSLVPPDKPVIAPIDYVECDPKTVEKTRRCPVGSYGCTKNTDCTRMRCEDSRCICPSHLLMSVARKTCVFSCAMNEERIQGECLHILRPHRDSDPDSKNSSRFPNGHEKARRPVRNDAMHLLPVTCNKTSQCLPHSAFCNTDLYQCECYHTYRVANNSCELDPLLFNKGR